MTRSRPTSLIYAIGTAGFPGILLIAWLLLPMIFSSRRDISSYASLDQTAVIQLSLCAIGGGYGIWNFLVSADLRRFIWSTPLCWYFAYLMCCLVLSPGSVNPAYSVVALLDIIGFTLTVAVLTLRFKDNYEIQIRWLCATGIFFAWVVIAKDLDRNWLDIRSWHDAAVFATFPVMFLPLYRLRKFIFSFVFMLALAILSTSVKVYLGLMAAAGVYCVVLCRRHQIFGGILLAVVAIIILWEGGNADTFVDILTSTRSETAVATGNGRFTVWPLLLEMGLQSPWTGYGFAMAEKYAADYIGLYMSSSHNVFLTAFLYAGVPGFCIFSLFVFASLRYLYRTGKRIPFANTLWISFIAIVVFICFDQGMGNKLMISTYSQTLFFCFAVKFCYDHREEKPERKNWGITLSDKLL